MAGRAGLTGVPPRQRWPDPRQELKMGHVGRVWLQPVRSNIYCVTNVLVSSCSFAKETEEGFSLFGFAPPNFPVLDEMKCWTSSRGLRGLAAAAGSGSRRRPQPRAASGYTPRRRSTWPSTARWAWLALTACTVCVGVVSTASAWHALRPETPPSGRFGRGVGSGARATHAPTTPQPIRNGQAARRPAAPAHPLSAFPLPPPTANAAWGASAAKGA